MMERRDYCKIIFEIDKKQRIQVTLPCVLHDIYRYDDIKVMYIGNNLTLLIYTEDFDDYLFAFNSVLKKILAGEYELSPALSSQNLGLQWNNYLHKSSITDESLGGWTGEKYLLWETHQTDAWLYPKEGKIFFEITPGYKWHYIDPKPEETDSYITYQQFIKNYKPYVITELSRDTAREWLRQTERLLAIIKANDDRYVDNTVDA